MQIEIDERPFEFDESLPYFDFYLDVGREPRLINISMIDLLKHAHSKDAANDQELIDYMVYLSRWEHDAPRKRFFRKQRNNDGMHVVSSEYFFENEEDGDKWIDALENTGKLAVSLLDHLGVSKRYYDKSPRERSDEINCR